MAKPTPTTAEERIARMAQEVAVLRGHTHPGAIVTSATPAEITGSRSAALASVVQQLLVALDELGLIDDSTTG